MAKTLLLADDSVTIQKVVSISFASEDVTLVTVDNGDDAIERAREVRPDMILADVVMPGKSGYEVCEAVKADPDLRHVPVLLLSGTFEAFDEEHAARVGADGHIAKPFESQSLVEQVNSYLHAVPTPTPSVAVPVPAPEVAAPSAAADPEADSFDFFDDDLGAAEPDAPEPAPEASDLDLSDSAFAMGDDDLIPPEISDDESLSGSDPEDGFVGTGEIYPDRTLALVPDDDAPASEIPPTAIETELAPLDPGDELVASVEEEADDSFVTVDPASTADEAFDFSFERESTAPEALRAAAPVATLDDSEVDDLVDGAVLDADADDALDVAPMPELESSDMNDLPDATRVVDVAPPMESVSEAIAVEALDEPSAAPPPMPPPATHAERGDAAARVDAVLAKISPELRETMHDTLEKIAWEAFGDVTETIVREVVDRVEKVAWEVVPQLTETLIKAEIQRLKGDSES